MKITAVIPTLDPSEKILEVVSELFEADFSKVLIINDGSNASKDYIFAKLQDMGCVVLDHGVNKGKGAALKTALTYAISDDCDGIITLDDDKQHLTKDIVNCAKAMESAKDSLVLGVRDFNDPKVPPKSKYGNKATANFFRFACGIKISDTQTGLRGIPRSAFEVFLNSQGDRFEYETNMLLDTKKNNISILEVPIETVYIENNKSTHFNPIVDSIKIYGQLFKFLGSSLFSFGVDFGLFTLFSLILPIEESTKLIFVSSFLARAVSSFVNYSANKKLVFNSDDSMGSTLLKYYTLCVAQTGVSALLTSILTAIVPTLMYIFKILVDVGLFCCSYKIQQIFVFTKKKK